MRMLADIKAYTWNDSKWDGWWQGDTGEAQIFEGVELLQRDNNQIYIGTTMQFEVENGDDYWDGSKGHDRYVMEATKVDFISGDFTLEGFVHVEHYGENAKGGGRNSGPYTKQRWVVTLNANR